MTPDILTFLEKLPPFPPGQPLVMSGPLIDASVDRVKRLIDNLEGHEYIKLGILLQHTSPNNFTEGELRQVAKLPIDLLDNNINEELPKVIKPYSRMFDTGSVRTQGQLRRAGLDGVKLSYIYARRGSVTPKTLVMGAMFDA
jgi:hypothetical protein